MKDEKLPIRQPRNMPGMAKLLAQAQTLPFGNKPATNPVMPGSEQWAKDVVAPLAARAALAERKVANVERVLEHFAAQAARIEEPDHPQRQVVEVMIQTLRDVIAAADREASNQPKG